MEDLGLVGDLAVLLVAALVGGAVAHALRLPVLLGYLAAGLAALPHPPPLGVPGACGEGDDGDGAAAGRFQGVGSPYLTFPSHKSQAHFTTDE